MKGLGVAGGSVCTSSELATPTLSSEQVKGSKLQEGYTYISKRDCRYKCSFECKHKNQQKSAYKISLMKSVYVCSVYIHIYIYIHITTNEIVVMSFSPKGPGFRTRIAFGTASSWNGPRHSQLSSGLLGTIRAFSRPTSDYSGLLGLVGLGRHPLPRL